MNKHGSKWIRPSKRKRLYARDSWTCCYCERYLGDEVASKRTLDHIVCRAHGGTNHESNLVTACITCNSSRKDTVLGGSLLQKALEWASRPLPEEVAA